MENSLLELYKEAAKVDDSEMFEIEDLPEANIEFAKNIYQLISNLSNDTLDENFTSTSKLKKHFIKHCLAGSKKKSIRTDVLYDFNKLSEYSNYEQSLSSDIQDCKNIIYSLYNTQDVIKAFHKLFEGNCCIIFYYSCGFITNTNQSVAIAFKSFANNATKNYSQNTIDYMMYDNLSTKTLFALDANYLENKFNNLVIKWNNKYHTPFAINH